MCLIFIPVFLLFLSSTCGYPKGAPPLACITFTPNHFGASSQRSEIPYNVRLGEVLYPNGPNLNTTIQITITGDVTFKGFLILAKDMDDVNGPPLGNWQSVSDDAKTLNCLSGGEAMTHTGPVNKTKVDLKWIVSGEYKGKIKFIYTVVEKFETFWAGKESAIITLDHSKSVQHPETQVTPQVEIKKTISTTTTTPTSTSTELHTFPEFHTDPTPARNYNSVPSSNSEAPLIVNIGIIFSLLLLTSSQATFFL